MNGLQGSMHYTPRVVLLDLSGSLGGVQRQIIAMRRIVPIMRCSRPPMQSCLFATWFRRTSTPHDHLKTAGDGRGNRPRRHC
jgi:hypothetical protein